MSVLLVEAKEHGVLSTPFPTPMLTWGLRREHLGMDVSVVSSALASFPSAPGAASSSYVGMPLAESKEWMEVPGVSAPCSP